MGFAKGFPTFTREGVIKVNKQLALVRQMLESNHQRGLGETLLEHLRHQVESVLTVRRQGL